MVLLVIKIYIYQFYNTFSQHIYLNREKNLVKKALVCGAGGFIGGHLVKRLKNEVESMTILTTRVRQKTSLKSLGMENHNKINFQVSHYRQVP